MDTLYELEDWIIKLLSVNFVLFLPIFLVIKFGKLFSYIDRLLVNIDDCNVPNARRLPPPFIILFLYFNITFVGFVFLVASWNYFCSYISFMSCCVIFVELFGFGFLFGWFVFVTSCTIYCTSFPLIGLILLYVPYIWNKRNRRYNSPLFFILFLYN